MATDSLYIGRKVKLEVALPGVLGAAPGVDDWKYLGPCNTKSFNLSADTVDGTTDQTTGGIRANYVTYGSCEISVDGKLREGDKVGELHSELVIARMEAIAAGNQPTVWARVTFPDITITGLFIFSEYTREAPDSDLANFSATFMATESATGITIAPTV